MKSVYGLDYVLLNTRNPDPSQIELVEKCHRFWKRSWEQTFRELRSVRGDELRSDDFLDREVGVLVHQGEPIGLFFNNWFDISRDSVTSHSYFKNYPSEVIEHYRRMGLKEVMLLAYMTLDPEWRKSQTDVQISDLLFSLGVMRFMEGQWPALIGYIRKDNNTHKIFYRHGGIKLNESQAYNVPVDFCYLTRDSARLSTLPGVSQAALYLWNRMKQREVGVDVMGQFERNIGPLEKAFTEFPWESKQAYAAYLANTYRYISHSTKLLAFAAEHAKSAELKNCLLHHVSEEQGHENWALTDLKRLGYDISQFPELPQAKALYDTIYEGIKRHGPAAIIGYAIALEGLSARKCGEIASRLIKTYGPKCSTLIKNHGDVDPGHFGESREILKFFDDREKAVIVRFMKDSIDRYQAFLNALIEQASTAKAA